MKNISHKDIPNLIGSIIQFIYEGTPKLYIIVGYNQIDGTTDLFGITENKFYKSYQFPISDSYWVLI